MRRLARNLDQSYRQLAERKEDFTARGTHKPTLLSSSAHRFFNDNAVATGHVNEERLDTPTGSAFEASTLGPKRARCLSGATTLQILSSEMLTIATPIARHTRLPCDFCCLDGPTSHALSSQLASSSLRPCVVNDHSASNVTHANSPASCGVLKARGGSRRPLCRAMPPRRSTPPKATAPATKAVAKAAPKTARALPSRE